MTEQYKCPSYYDDNSVLQDCTCGKCGSKADWLRSEIERLEGAREEFVCTNPDPEPAYCYECQEEKTANKVFAPIITRYKEELLELAKGV